ncbi:MAG: hypothetical protein NTW03_18625 [Verrucomicrobia bacterium]|nr:hypothetical protein [Verrucomicrobiota bacterium]
MKNLTLRASELWLQHGPQGPEWKVKLWAAKLKNPNHDADVAVVVVSADDGSVVKCDLHPEHVD